VDDAGGMKGLKFKHPQIDSSSVRGCSTKEKKTFLRRP